MLEAVVSLLGTGLIGVIAWAVTLNSRVAVLEADKITIRELIDVRLVSITERLDRIEKKIDKEKE
jgi:hypothetical protein